MSAGIFVLRRDRLRMTTITVPLTMPIRRIIATDPSADPPHALLRQFEHLRWRTTSGAAQPRSKSSSIGPSDERDCELDRLREQRTALDHVLAELRQAVRMLHTRLDQLLPEIQHVAIELAQAIASKLVLNSLMADQFPIENLVREVIERLHTKDPLVVRLHPADLAVWQQHGDQELLPSCEAELQIIPDASLSRGDCRATVGEITVVYDLRRQIEDIRRELLSTVDGHARTES